ncbi:MAG: hypothetical protein PUJ55_05000 [Clostridiales bacterium]|nr:hypothetical protein [Clostridiales bacterium]
MKDILEKLYFGEVRTAEKDIMNDDMKRKCTKMVHVEEEVMKSLDDKTKVMFEQYLQVSGEVHADAVIESYKEGFRTAVRLILAGLAE